MFEVQLFIPLADNEEREFTASEHAEFERILLERFGGVSLLSGTVTGQWMQGGVTYRDRLRVYMVALTSIAHGHMIGEVVRFAKAHYRQEKVYVRYLGLSETL